MKNLVMTVAAAATMIFAAQNMTAQETAEDVAMNQTEAQAPVQDGFEKIEASALPETVTTAVTADKAGSEVTEAFFNEELGVYKLMLQAEGTEAETAYINAEGKWVTVK
ncbi:hypothetical protein [Leeuwenhoekiella sp. NPDC079379]|uniref:hypothetical protein n=1 Tax=Leeuwenhoekiella sp. NPDC079379 TaxID=3364122 RepID=UPI0037C9525E